MLIVILPVTGSVNMNFCIESTAAVRARLLDYGIGRGNLLRAFGQPWLGVRPPCLCLVARGDRVLFVAQRHRGQHLRETAVLNRRDRPQRSHRLLVGPVYARSVDKLVLLGWVIDVSQSASQLLAGGGDWHVHSFRCWTPRYFRTGRSRADARRLSPLAGLMVWELGADSLLLVVGTFLGVRVVGSIVGFGCRAVD